MRYTPILLALCVLISPLPARASSDVPTTTQEMPFAEITATPTDPGMVFHLSPDVVYGNAGGFDPLEFTVFNGTRGFVWHAVGIAGTYTHACLYLGSVGGPLELQGARVHVYTRGHDMFPSGGTNTHLASSLETDMTVLPVEDARAYPTGFRPYCFGFEQEMTVEEGEVYAFAIELTPSHTNGRLLGGVGYPSHAGTHQAYSGNIENTTVWAGVAMPFMLRTDGTPPVEPIGGQKGISSVFFLPGIQGSRLYEEVLSLERRRWELGIGTSQLDALALYLNPDGSSKQHTYTKEGAVVDRIDIPLVGFDVYRTFLGQLARLKSEGTIPDYHAFPYDWRMDPIDIVEQGTPYEDGLRFASVEVEKLASSSPTGKVTIVGHSNGGLVAKALIQRLAREGKGHLVDTVVLVSVPQLGTPQALPPMLHGDFGGLTSLGGLYLSKANARGLVEYMPSAYALLPSEEYFSRVDTPVIDLSGAPQLATSDTSINEYRELEAFLTSGTREKPPSEHVSVPGVLSPSLLAKAKDTHSLLDSWTAPGHVRVVQIAGWGLDTPSGIEYTEGKSCSLVVVCDNVLEHSVTMSLDGDRTVVAPSQVALAKAENFYINLYEANKGSTAHMHADITESAPFQELFEYVLASSSAALPEFISRTLPQPSPNDRRLRLRTSSSTALHAYDNQGRHTGPAGEVGGMPTKEEGIPNSYFFEFAGGSYIGLPADGAVRIQLVGTTQGATTYTMEAVTAGKRTSTTVFRNVPMTASTTGVLRVVDGSLAIPELALDTDGDGEVDTTIAPGDAEVPHPPEDKNPGDEIQEKKKKTGKHKGSSLASLAKIRTGKVLGTSTMSVGENATHEQLLLLQEQVRQLRVRLLMSYLRMLEQQLPQVTLTPTQAASLKGLLFGIKSILI